MSWTTDTYVTPDEADDFFDLRLDSTPWQEANPQQRQASLYQATKIIDSLKYRGVKYTDYTTSVLGRSDTPQVLEFPRYPNNSAVLSSPPPVPEGVRIACCLIALALLDGVDPSIEQSNVGVLSQRFATLGETYDPLVIREWEVAGVPSAEAWNNLLPFLIDPRAIRTRRV